MINNIAVITIIVIITWRRPCSRSGVWWLLLLWFWVATIDTEIVLLLLLVGFLDGCWPPMVLTFWVSLFCVVFSMGFDPYWSWHFGFFVCCVVFSMVVHCPVVSTLGLLWCYGFTNGCWYTSGQCHLKCACWKCCFATAKQHTNLKTCIWPRQNVCFQNCSFRTVKHHDLL